MRDGAHRRRGHSRTPRIAVYSGMVLSMAMPSCAPADSTNTAWYGNLPSQRGSWRYQPGWPAKGTLRRSSAATAKTRPSCAARTVSETGPRAGMGIHATASVLTVQAGCDFRAIQLYNHDPSESLVTRAFRSRISNDLPRRTSASVSSRALLLRLSRRNLQTHSLAAPNAACRCLDRILVFRLLLGVSIRSRFPFQYDRSASFLGLLLRRIGEKTCRDAPFDIS